MYCGKCGTQNDDAARFCTRCGAALSTARSVGAASDDSLNFRDTIVAEIISPGKLLSGRYRVLERLGVGGMGEVFKAADAEMDDMAVAVKVLPPLLARNQRSVQDLKREAAIALRLTHSSICRLHNFHSDEEIKFLVMELIQGRTLEQILADRDDGKLPWAELEPIARQIASALEYAHGLDPPVLHRDIKPSNIMVTPNGKAKLLDFGIAREMQDSMTRLSGQMSSAGTLPYMSPEQFRGEPLDPRSDIYSLCVVLFEALAGVAMVNPGGSVAWQVQEKKFQPLADAPAEANAILAAGLKKGRDDRVRILFRDSAGAAVPVADVDDASVADMAVAKPPEAEPAERPAKEPAEKPVAPPPEQLERARPLPLVKLELDPTAPPVRPHEDRAEPPAAAAPAAGPAPTAAPAPAPAAARPRPPGASMAIFLRVMGALPVVSLPITLSLLISRLGRHVRGRLDSTALTGERFHSGEGRIALDRLRRCAGRTRRPGLTASLILAPIMLAALLYLLVVPGLAPWPFDDYADVMGSMLSCGPTRYVAYKPSKFHYGMVKSAARYVAYEKVREERPYWGKGKEEIQPVVTVQLEEGGNGRPPYAFWGTEPYEGIWKSKDTGRYWFVRVHHARCYWRASETLGVVFYAVFIPLVVLSSGWVFVTWAIRFIHHSTAEARAAEIASGEVKFMPQVTQANYVRIGLAAGMLLTGTFLLLVPLLCAGWLGGHRRWERESGLDAALGVSVAG